MYQGCEEHIVSYKEINWSSLKQRELSKELTLV